METKTVSRKSWDKRKIVCTVSILVIFCCMSMLLAGILPAAVMAEKNATGTIQDAALTSKNATNGMAKLFSDKLDGMHFTNTFDDFFLGSSAYMQKIQSMGFGAFFFPAITKAAMAIATIAMLLHVIDIMPDFPDNPAILAKPVVQYGIAMEIIANAGNITDSLTLLGKGVMTAVRGWQKAQFATFECTDVAATMGQMYGPAFKVTAQLLVGLEVMLMGVGLTILMFFVDLQVYKQCFVVLIELILYGMFLPLGAAWIPLEGVRGSGIYFVKRYAGTWLKIAMFYAIAAISGTLMSIVVQDGTVNFRECLYIVSIALSVPGFMKTSNAVLSNILAG